MKANLRLLLSIIISGVFTIQSFSQSPKYQFTVTQKMIRNAKSAELGTIFKAVEIIPLEGKDECWIGKVQEIQITKDNIFVLSKEGSEGGKNSLMRFTRSGEFVSHIGRHGKGPGEYTSIGDFSIVDDNKKILLLNSRHILVYDFSGGFINSIELTSGESNVLPTIIETLQNGDYLAESSGSFNLGIFENNGSLKRQYSALKNNNIDLPCPFTSFKENIMINMLFQDNVYCLNNNGQLYPYFLLDFGELNLDIPSYIEYSKDNYGQLPKNKIIRTNFIETESSFIVKFSYQWKDYIGTIDKSNLEPIIYKLENRNICQTHFPASFFYSESEGIVTWANPSQFNESFKDWKQKENNNPIYHFISDREVNENSNPIVVILKTK